MKEKTTLKKKRQIRKLPKAVRSEEFKELIKVIKPKDIIAKISFLLAYGSGMRISEVLRCQKEHFRSNSIFIPPSKYRVERIVPIPKRWEESFLEYLPIKRTKRCLQRKFKIYSKKAGLNLTYTFFSLRHGFVLNALEKGLSFNQVQALSGSSEILNLYKPQTANPLDAIKSYEKLF